MVKILRVFILLIALLAVLPPQAKSEVETVSIERADSEELAVAIGHYARARALILAAIREFDAGLKHANPQALIEVHEWRNDLIDRAEDLEKVLSPQPRATKGGVQFEADPRLMGEAQR